MELKVKKKPFLISSESNEFTLVFYNNSKYDLWWQNDLIKTYKIWWQPIICCRNVWLC